MADDVPPDDDASTTPFSKGGLYGTTYKDLSLPYNVRAIIAGYRWATQPDGTTPATEISYFFPTTKNDYLADPDYPTQAKAAVANFQPVSDVQKEAILTSFDLIESYTLLRFTLGISGLAANATLRFSRNLNDGGSSAYYPYADHEAAGDNYLGSNGYPPDGAFVGTDHFNTIMHELGHSLGLKHGHEFENGSPALTPDYNDNEFSVMTYWSYMNAGGITEAINGSSPQSFMMFDIAALQAMYGVNWGLLGKQATYSWSETTGLQTLKVDNQTVTPFFDPAEKTGSKIFETVWTQGATTTYDLSNFSDNQHDDMRPGMWMKFSGTQIADLNKHATAGTADYQAMGNVYNALLYQGDTRSEISNLKTGTGNDWILGNDVANVIYANDGDDEVRGGLGDDTLYGEAGDDHLTGEDGNDTLYGGIGNDTYMILSAGSTIVEQAGEGSDTVFVFVDNYTVGANVETVWLAQGVTTVTGNDTGTTITARNGIATTITGGAGADMLYGANQADTLHGGGGNDYLRGREGNDTLYGEADDDNLIGEDGNDTLYGGIGNDTYMILSAGSTIVEQVGEGNDTAIIFVDNYTIGANVETAQLAQGVTTVTGNDTGMTIYARNGFAATLNGGTGNDTLLGADQADTLRGGRGNDVLNGGAGNDTFAFARGDGNDRLFASAVTGSDTVAFDAGVAYTQLWFARSINDLVISVIGEDQSVTVSGWYASAGSRLSDIIAGDGYTSTASGIDLLVQAMSAFAPPSLGQTTLPDQLAADLAPALAANWQHA